MKSKSDEKRKNERFLSGKRALLDFAYHFEANLDVSPLAKKRTGSPSFKHSAVVKDVSVDGMCFHSPEKMRRGAKLNLEVYIPGGNKPVHMEGQVRWSKASLATKEDNQGYDTGVRLTVIEDRSVYKSIHFDEMYHVYWSDVLESIIGQFKTIQRKMRST